MNDNWGLIEKAKCNIAWNKCCESSRRGFKAKYYCFNKEGSNFSRNISVIKILLVLVVFLWSCCSKCRSSNLNTCKLHETNWFNYGLWWPWAYELSNFIVVQCTGSSVAIIVWVYILYVLCRPGEKLFGLIILAQDGVTALQYLPGLCLQNQEILTLQWYYILLFYMFITWYS